MDQTTVSKISGKSRSYVSKVASGKIENEITQSIMSLLGISNEDFLKSILADERFLNICQTGIMRCKRLEDRQFAAYLAIISERLRK